MELWLQNNNVNILYKWYHTIILAGLYRLVYKELNEFITTVYSGWNVGPGVCKWNTGKSYYR